MLVALLLACNQTDDPGTPTNTDTSAYKGTASVSQGIGTTTASNLFSEGQRVAALGKVTSSDGKTWTVPADVNYTNASFPVSSDLNNPYNAGHSYNTASEAVNALNGSDVVTVDNAGELFTAYIFADNYFEMYVNGTPVGKDAVPFTEFNSSIVRFKASVPFTVAVKCVDWEENLGIGTEMQGNSSMHVGDGGFVAVIKNSSGVTVGVTDDTWKAQTFYTSPITDLTCPTESGNYRYSSDCSTNSVSANSYALHWEVPSDWYIASFDDSNWPKATTFTNETVGVDNKRSYTNFTNIFDDSSNDASFIWSTNLLLDNMVLLRKTIK